GDFEMPVGAAHFGHAIVLDLVNLIVRRDPARQVLPVKHFALWLHVEERHDGLVRTRVAEAEGGERSLGEGERGERHAAANHVTAGEGGGVHILYLDRSEERRVGKECRFWCAAGAEKKKHRRSHWGG